jgi:plasmid stabilization system protein ParE
VSARVVVRPDAQAEIAAARDWYEERRSALGDEFLGELHDVIARIADRPALYPRVHGDVRRAVLRRFPYAAYFVVADEEIVVLAVMHGHRHPRVWRRRR